MPPKSETILTGKKRIMAFVGRSWPTIMLWVEEMNFPARKLNGVWESDTELIIEWRKKEIQRQLKKTEN